MTIKRYAKQIFRELIEPSRDPEVTAPVFHLDGKAAGEGIDISFFWCCVSQPLTMEKKPMVHEFDQVLGFVGSDPENMEEFDAEIDFYLGKEGEKQIITEPAFFYIPKGLIHCPLTFKRLGKPIMMVDITLTPNYVRIIVPD